MTLSKKLLIIPAMVMALGAGLALAPRSTVVADNDNSAIVGTWVVSAHAPFAPHLATFNADGTLNITNPTGVEENLSAPRGGTHDSIGMGVWRVQNDHGDKIVVGTFQELNVYVDPGAATHKVQSPTLSVTFKLKLSDNNNHFVGPAQASYTDGTVFPQSNTADDLVGDRMMIDQPTVDLLHF